MVQGAFCMCRKNRALGACLAAAGAGALVALLIGGGVIAVIFALVLLGCGVCMAGKS